MLMLGSARKRWGGGGGGALLELTDTLVVTQSQLFVIVVGRGC